ncbi:MAG TPA: hypothetical protein VMU62_05410, partial [Acidobacteriaceae bacterium]|nr:hypothetical protein [Acidobacteriaceae bacterium]
MTIAWQGDELERRRRSNPEPQILPPEEVDFRSGDFRSDDSSYRIDPAAAVQNQPAQSSRSRILIGWSYAPATYVLVGINIAVYGCMVLGGVSWWAPTAQQILHWGANRG